MMRRLDSSTGFLPRASVPMALVFMEIKDDTVSLAIAECIVVHYNYSVMISSSITYDFRD